jgi:hypothetical protein
MSVLIGLTVHAVVMDGVTLGRPTCGVPHCTIPLSNKRHRFCPIHVHFNQKCAIVGCNERISAPDKRTCNDPTHQRVEDVHVERGEATFQLKEKLKRAKVAHPKNGEALDLPVAHIIEQDDELDETYEIVGDRVIPSDAESITQTALARASLNATLDTSDNPVIQTTLSPPPSAKKKIRAQFGRSRTHNEQILVAPCGMRLLRAGHRVDLYRDPMSQPYGLGLALYTNPMA